MALKTSTGAITESFFFGVHSWIKSTTCFLVISNFSCRASFDNSNGLWNPFFQYYVSNFFGLGSTFEAELGDVIPVVKASIAGTRVIGRMCVGKSFHLNNIRLLNTICVLERIFLLSCLYWSWPFMSLPWARMGWVEHVTHTNSKMPPLVQVC